MVETQKYAILDQFLWVQQSTSKFLATRFDTRNRLVQLINNDNLKYCPQSTRDSIFNTINQYPYNALDNTIT
jgi:hypothetical protein